MMQPLVSIGLPVFNGAELVGRSIASLLAQDYANLEIIISDNASTDGTQEICEGYARLDQRVRYIRHAQNRGASENFNYVVDQATGEYFMWAAHDDTRDHQFVSACVGKLQGNPQAVLCQTHTDVVLDSTNDLLCVNSLASFEGLHNVYRRYWETLTQFPMTGIYGLYRTEAIRKTARFTRSIASDVAFVRELSLQGEFTQVGRTLFTYRIRDRWNDVNQDYRVFTGRAGKPFWYIPFLVLYANDARRILRSAHPFPGKILLLLLLTSALALEKVKRLLVWGARAGTPTGKRNEMAQRMYWGMFHNRNVEVVSHPAYRERIINPIILS